MGILTLGKAFSKNLLRIEISGPDRPHLTIVDLPGLVHSENKHQSASDIELITDVVKNYMKEPRSIILAVVSAKNDYANQIVLKLARETDSNGTRTLGVITKPDTLSPGSGSEDMYISLARNQDVEFRLGWHVLRNKDTDTEGFTLTQRDAHEAKFFSRGAWASLSSSQLGIVPLRNRLSRLLLHQICSELPNLTEEILAKSAMCQEQLDKLGQPRTSDYEQRVYLVQISYQKRIRGIIQNLNLDFATKLGKYGQRYRIEPGVSDGRATMTRADFIEKIVGMMDRSRGRELPNMFSPMIVSDLFKEQSSPWKAITEAHATEVWNAAELFMRHLITHVADITTAKAVLDKIVEPKLDCILKSLCDKVSGLLKSHKCGHPITYNHHFTDSLQKIRLQRLTSEATCVLNDAFGDVSLDSTSYVSQKVDFGELLRRLVRERTQNINHYTAFEALDCLDAYYKVALKRFIDDVAVEVIETCLVAQLGGILSPLAAFMMSQDEVAQIAGETEETRTARGNLEGKLNILRSGAEICKRFAGSRVTCLVDKEPEENRYSVIWDHANEAKQGMTREDAELDEYPTLQGDDTDGPTEAAKNEQYEYNVLSPSRKKGKKKRRAMNNL
ncbi:hypothetical protein CDD83_76 [Cordyceps sp. RAO-2017]|nr:hypothetical protein CDD83_76 [Cordyceps sp. RAO-2017]